MLSTHFCPSFNANLGATPKFEVRPQSCETFRKQNRSMGHYFVLQFVRVLFLKVGLNKSKVAIDNLIKDML